MNSNDLIEKVISSLNENGLTNEKTIFDYDVFLNYKKNIARVGWEVPSTTITPTMERLLFSIGQGISGNVVCLGSYYGYGMLWLALNDNIASYYGVDTDSKACNNAKNNFKRVFEKVDNINIKCENALRYVEEFEDQSVDLLFIDVENESSKALYSVLLEKWYKKLKEGALVLAHDPCIKKFEGDFKKYYKVTGDRTRFLNEIILPIDECGIHIARVRRDNNENNRHEFGRSKN